MLWTSNNKIHTWQCNNKIHMSQQRLWIITFVCHNSAIRNVEHTKYITLGSSISQTKTTQCTENWKNWFSKNHSENTSDFRGMATVQYTGLNKPFYFTYHKQYSTNGPESPFTNTYAAKHPSATNHSGEQLFFFWLNVVSNFWLLVGWGHQYKELYT